jgi:subtilisin family serine protease
MNALDLVRLPPLMARTGGRPEITIGLIDGPVAMDLPDLGGGRIRELPGTTNAACSRADSTACLHGTFVAGILAAKRDSPAPAISPDCTLLVRPIFSEATIDSRGLPSAGPEDLAAAIVDCADAGVRLINLSLALARPSPRAERGLEQALDHAARRGVLVVVAAGNQGSIASSAITRHPWVIPVVAYNLQGRPLGPSNFGHSIGRRGLGAPGENVTSLGSAGSPETSAGTSVAAPFVTGTIALLWSEFPTAQAAAVRLAVTQACAPRRTAVVPPLLDAWAAYQLMKSNPRR